MTKELWINLPVVDLTKTKAFFQALGFEVTLDTPNMVGFKIGEKQIQVMMVEHSVFQRYSAHGIADTREGAEILLSFDAATRTHVDKMTERVRQAGGTIFAEPSDIEGWMYGFGFTDPDGHRWNMVYFDWDKMPGR